jgi:hypothetical protein
MVENSVYFSQKPSRIDATGKTSFTGASGKAGAGNVSRDGPSSSFGTYMWSIWPEEL